MARRAGQLVLGTHAVKEAARRGELVLAVMARDATENAKDRVLPLLAALDVPVAWCAKADRLGASLGRSRTVVVGLRDGGLAGRVIEALEWNGTDADPRTRGSNEESV